jgi:hypothetical protein
VLTRECLGAARARFAVAIDARVIVMRFAVALLAVCSRWQMQWTRVARRLDARMAYDAVDPLQHVRAMFERMRRIGSPNAENTRARGDRKRDDQPKK